MNEIFNKAYSKDFVHYYLESYLQKPPGVVFRYIAELQYVVESIDNSGMMYRRATCLTMDPKEVDIRKWIKESRKKFSSRDSRVFKEEIMSSTDISESDKKKACENLDSFGSILGNIRENVHVCCYSDDFFAGLKEGERWVKTGFKGGMFCIDTSIFDDLHRAYYGPELRIRSHSNFLKRMLINGASEREAKSLYCDILAEMYYRLYKKRT